MPQHHPPTHRLTSSLGEALPEFVMAFAGPQRRVSAMGGKKYTVGQKIHVELGLLR